MKPVTRNEGKGGIQKAAGEGEVVWSGGCGYLGRMSAALGIVEGTYREG